MFLRCGHSMRPPALVGEPGTDSSGLAAIIDRADASSSESGSWAGMDATSRGFAEEDGGPTRPHSPAGRGSSIPGSNGASPTHTAWPGAITTFQPAKSRPGVSPAWTKTTQPLIRVRNPVKLFTIRPWAMPSPSIPSPASDAHWPRGWRRRYRPPGSPAPGLRTTFPGSRPALRPLPC